MSVQFIGMIGHRLSSEIIPATGPVFDKQYIADFAKAHEKAGFDRILVGYWSDQPDGFLVAAHAGAHTSTLKFLLAHRPGFVEPTLAARKLATLDNLLDGRLAVHIISGGSDAEQRRDGDFLEKSRRYARTEEFLQVVKKSWYSSEGYDHRGEFYQAENAFTAIKPYQAYLPVYFGGSSDDAMRVAGKHADVFALWGEPLASAAETVKAVKAEAARYQREVGFSISFRPILGRTEAEAWEKAEAIRAQTKAQLAQSTFSLGKPKPQSVGAQRLQLAVAQGDRLDDNLWTGIAALVGGGYNSTALVGTPDQVSDALLKYYDLGIETFLIRGFDPLNDATEYGRELIPLTRQKISAREQVALKNRLPTSHAQW
ncbi:alkanesulfonate monooxygenase [Rouxiella silvae]|uniref:Alkanesulfonate monooxygenase n=1 Tax=Rouxiella silvae TaxID=1646373 RepID=A0AA40X267_9GAMM|nr:LLM class flavin-dependent oxidoreductase [Rouxiella silvae]KQN52112.1 alkanesulfonate monooxygenase [Serratia sp. Leaf50]MBF6637210.1 LLM class flavin-dependent oxidoreductase [Rouxiella silvae]ORJ20675.1 alkanesulfonate monooxygenase [Rouxiella silvae]